MTPRQSALLAALEHLRVADRILAGIEGAPRSSDQRLWEKLAAWNRFFHWPFGLRYNGRYAYVGDDTRSVNTELFEAQAELAQARSLVGLGPEAIAEIPVEMEQLQAISDRERRPWTLEDDLAVVGRVRHRVRELFSGLRAEDAWVRDRVAPLDAER
jgi:hypothetical protein